MKAQPRTTLSFKLDKAILSPFSNLLQQGFLLEIPTGSTIKSLLFEHVNVEENYLEDRVQTIFLDGKPVDDVDKTILKNGANLALSAAMPGLVGSTFRRGGVLATFRSGITYQQEDAIPDNSEEALIRIKLFNILISELGPVFLNKGIIVNKGDVNRVFIDRGTELETLVGLVEMDEKEISYDQLTKVNWSGITGNLLLKVSVSSGVNNG